MQKFRRCLLFSKKRAVPVGSCRNKKFFFCYVDRLAVKGTGNKFFNYGPDYSGDFYQEKFILEARQTLLYGKIRVIVDPFLSETPQVTKLQRKPALVRPALAKSTC